MNTNSQTQLCCPRCQSDTGIVILGRDGFSILVECHRCLTLQVARLPRADQHPHGKLLRQGEAAVG